MVTSKVVRPKRKTLTSTIETASRYKKVTVREKLLKTLKEYNKGLPIIDLCFKANVKSAGQAHQVLKFLLKSKEVVKERCPHCNSTDLYKLPK